MRILITGGTGFIGKVLCQKLLAEGHELMVFSRQVDALSSLGNPAGVEIVHSLEVVEPGREIDAIINLAGEPIADRLWSDSRKQALWDSRISTTEALIELTKRLHKKPEVLVSASAVGYYGDTENRVVDETAIVKGGTHFSHRLCDAWEAEARLASESGIRVVIVRIGVVLGEGGGILKRMKTPFKLCLGGRMGEGKQWMSWIHRDDLVNMLIMLTMDTSLKGIFNAVSPNPVTNADYTHSLGEILGRPTVLNMPAPVLTLIAGEMAELFLASQRVYPARFLEAGFTYKFKQLNSALRDALQ